MDLIAKGDRARKFLESDEWKEAWSLYNDRLYAEFKACPSENKDRLQQIKMLQLAGDAAKAHLERLMVDGQFAQKDIEFQAKQSRLTRVLAAIK